jgi:hypothetical protein
MLKDRAQKAMALKLAISMRWLPQLEIEVESETRLARSKYMLTDIDVLAVAPGTIAGNARLIFDCKSGTKESAIGRAFWLYGLMRKSSTEHGFIILNEKVGIAHDHRISASDFNVSLVHENELEDLAQCMGGTTRIDGSFAADIDTWDKFLGIFGKHPSIKEYLYFSRSRFWMINDAGERCRKTVARLRSIKAELDPSKPEHVSVFGDALCLFLLTLSEMTSRLYLVLVRPSSKEQFSETLLALLYGGYENLEAAQKIRRMTAGDSITADSISIFPEMVKFEQLIRELLQAPSQVHAACLLAREMAFTALAGADVSKFQEQLVAEAEYATKFVLLASEYLAIATRLPKEFVEYFSERTLSLSMNSLGHK